MRELVPHGGTSTARAKHVYDATILLFNLLLTQKLRDGVYKNIGSTERQGQWALQIIAVHKYIPSIYRYNSQGGESSVKRDSRLSSTRYGIYEYGVGYHLGGYIPGYITYYYRRTHLLQPSRSPIYHTRETQDTQ